jgi:hypothetical protein
MTDEVVDVRCPAGPFREDGSCNPGKLLTKIIMSGGKPDYVHPANLIELYCEECTHRLRRYRPGVRRVLHRYDFLGSFIETLVVDSEATSAGR